MAARPYSTLQVAIRYLNYWCSAMNGKGHGMHSPFIYRFIRDVLMDKSLIADAQLIEAYRAQCKQSDEFIQVTDLGAGSARLQQQQRAIATIAKYSAKPPKYAALLHRIVKYYQPKQLLELGTSLGVSTAYIAAAAPHAIFHTIEGDPSLAKLATEGLKELGYSHVQVINANFDAVLPEVLQQLNALDFVFVDGNHQYQATVDYAQQIIAKANDYACIVFDDIHWSEEMEAAWKSIQELPRVTLAVDLFFIGIVWLNPDVHVPQSFRIRF